MVSDSLSGSICLDIFSGILRSSSCSSSSVRVITISGIRCSTGRCSGDSGKDVVEYVSGSCNGETGDDVIRCIVSACNGDRGGGVITGSGVISRENGSSMNEISSVLFSDDMEEMESHIEDVDDMPQE